MITLFSILSRKMSKPLWILLFTFVVGMLFWYMVVIYTNDTQLGTPPSQMTSTTELTKVSDSPQTPSSTVVSSSDNAKSVQNSEFVELRDASITPPKEDVTKFSFPSIFSSASMRERSIAQPAITKVQKASSADDFKVPAPMSWSSFVHSGYVSPTNKFDVPAAEEQILQQCDAEILKELAKPGLSDADYRWCEWALSSSGGNVQVSLHRYIQYVMKPAVY